MKYKPLLLIFVILFLASCVVEQESYDSSGDDGTYTGTAVPYNTDNFPDTDLFNRTCPNVSITLVVNDGNFSLSLDDSYRDGFSPHVDVVTRHGKSGQVTGNNRFEAKDTWAIETTDTQLADLRTLGVCDASASPASNGRLSNLSFVVSDDYFVGQYGLGTARGSLIYGVDCTDGEFVEVCAYFMELTKQ